MQQIINLYQSIPGDVWATLLGGFSLSAFYQPFKRWIGLQNDHVKFLVSTLIALIAVGAQDLITHASMSPSYLGAHTATVIVVMQFTFRFVITPIKNIADNAEKPTPTTPVQQTSQSADFSA